MSQREALELRMMEENVQFDENLGKWRVRYPFLQNPRVLSNNYRRVLRMMERLERKLDKLGQTKAANGVFQKMISMGALEEVSAHELKRWTGPIHYLPIQGVINPSSVTTPLRLVTNSSLVDPETGLSLNSILAKGQMYLNDMWEILVRFRHYEAGLIGDISKAYYQIQTGPVEYHCRRVMWRNGEVGTPWRIFAFKVVSMGDTLLRGRQLSEVNTLTGGGPRDSGMILLWMTFLLEGHILSVRGSRVLRILLHWLVMGLGSRFWILGVGI